MSSPYLFNLGLNQKRLGGNNIVVAKTINLGSTRGLGSSTRKFVWCKEHSPNPSLCINEFITLKSSVNVSFPFTATGKYTYTYNNGYYVVVFASYTGIPNTTNPILNDTTTTGSITFLTNISDVQLILIGGGGRGGSNYGDSNGGGGGAGGSINEIIVNVKANSSYNIQVGGGGTISNTGIGQTTMVGTFSAMGGGYGGDATVDDGGVGAIGVDGAGGGGTGGTSGGADSTDGENGTPITINDNAYYYSGGGAGGSYKFQIGSANGGLGGGQGTGFSSGGNDGVDYYGPNGIYYKGNETIRHGYDGTGGGGGGGSRTVGSGGSGIVVFCFKYPA